MAFISVGGKRGQELGIFKARVSIDQSPIVSAMCPELSYAATGKRPRTAGKEKKG
jgi:hypothetical protein